MTVVAIAVLITVVGGVATAQSVTYDGEIQIDAHPAQDGDVFTYNLSDTSDIDSFTISLTGNTTSQNAEVADVLADGESTGYSVGGTAQPQNATLTIEGRSAGSGYVDIDSYSAPQTEEYLYGDIDTAASMHFYTESNEVHAYNYETGTMEWTADLSDTSAAVATSPNHVALKMGYNGNIHVYKRSDGTLVQNYSVADDVNNIEYAPSDGYFYYALANDNVGKLSNTSHNPDVETNSISDVAPPSTFTESGQFVWMDSADVTASTWTYSEIAGENGRLLSADGYTLVSVGGSPQKIALLDSSDGTELWRKDTVGKVVDMTVTPEGLAVIMDDGGGDRSRGDIRLLDLSDGSVKWSEEIHDQEGEVITSSSGVITSFASDGSVSTADSYHTYTTNLSTTDPEVSVGGSTEISVDGSLSAGETRSTSVSLSAGETGDITTSTGYGTSVEVSLNWTEITETQNPEVSVNGFTTSYDGTLSDGETASVSADTTWLNEGENTVELSVSSTADGPAGRVGLDYGHTATEERTVDYSASKWSEEYGLSYTYPSSVDSAEVSIPWESDNVIDVRQLSVSVDGTETSAYTSTTQNGTLTVDLGQLSANTTVEVDATGSKVDVVGGDIEVVNRSVGGEPLDSRIRVANRTDSFGIYVEGTTDGDLAHYTAEESYQTPTSTSVFTADGRQRLETNAPEGGRFNVRATPVGVEAAQGAVEVVITEPETNADPPRFTVSQNAETANPDTVDIGYYGAQTGEVWALYRTDTGEVIEEATAESPVWFTTSVEGLSYSVEKVASAPSSGSGVAVATGGSGGSGLDLTPTAMLLGTALSLISVFVLGRRFGIESNRVLGGLSIAIALVAIEALTNGSVISLTTEALLGPFSGSEGAVTVAVGVALLLGLGVLRGRIGVPRWIYYVAGGAVVLWLLETITSGAVSGAFSEVAPLFWVALIGGTLFLLYKRVQPRDIVLGRR